MARLTWLAILALLFTRHTHALPQPSHFQPSATPPDPAVKKQLLSAAPVQLLHPKRVKPWKSFQTNSERTPRSLTIKHFLRFRSGIPSAETRLSSPFVSPPLLPVWCSAIRGWNAASPHPVPAIPAANCAQSRTSPNALASPIDTQVSTPPHHPRVSEIAPRPTPFLDTILGGVSAMPVTPVIPQELLHLCPIRNAISV
jgi:hypothetical protein